MDDPLEHPDLVDLTLRMRQHLEGIEEAERAAAALWARRRSTLRDRLLAVEERAGSVTVQWASGASRTGRVTAVGIDYFEMTDHSVVLVSLSLAGFIEL